MLRPELLLHIGSPKTGTSHIQQTLIVNDDVLNNNKINYMNCCRWHDGAHHEFSFSLRKENYGPQEFSVEKSLECIRKEVSESNSSIHIISSEILFVNCESFLSDLKLLYGIFSKITVLIYLREPVSYISSLFKQMVKDPNNRVSESPIDFFKMCPEWIDYYSIVKSYESLSDNVVIYHYDNLRDSSEHFFNVVLNISDNYESATNGENSSLDGAALKLKHYFNKEVSDFYNNKKITQLIWDFAESENIPTHMVNLFSPAEIDCIRSHYQGFFPEFNDHRFPNSSTPDYSVESNFKVVSDEILVAFKDFVFNRDKDIHMLIR